MPCYAELEKKADELVIRLTAAGREFLKEQRSGDGTGLKRGTISILHNLLKDWLCNGWEFIRPEEIGALTSAPILSDDAKRNDQGELTDVGNVYWFSDYAVTCEIEELLAKGQVAFPKAD